MTFDWLTAYYVFCATALLYLAGLIVSVRRYMWLWYCGQSLLFVVYFAALDGHLNALLNFDAQHLALVAGTVGTLVCAYSVAMCGLLLYRKHSLVRLRPVLLAVAALLLAMPLLQLVIDGQRYHQLLAAVFWFVIVLQTLPPITWLFLPRWMRHNVMPGVVLMLLSIGLYDLFAGSGSGLQPGSESTVRRWIMLWITLSGATSMLAMTGVIQRAAISEKQLALEAAQRELAAARATQQAERAMARARELAAVRGEQLGRAAHDIKQPLLALRTAVRGLDKHDQTESTSNLFEAIDYVEKLAQNYLTLSEPGNEPDPAMGEELEAQLVLDSLVAMYGAEAESKEIAIRTVASRLTLQAPPLVLIRIAANGVANAIGHSGGSRLLIGWRRRGAYADLWILDNGTGIDLSRDKGQEKDPFAPHIKGEDSHGSGLGLAIVVQLAQEQGWRATLKRLESGGTGLRVAGIKVANS